MQLAKDFYNFALGKQDDLIEKLIDWVSINSWSYHFDGLNTMCNKIVSDFSSVSDECIRIAMPNIATFESERNPQRNSTVSSLHFIKRANAKTAKKPFQIYLGGHYDTVYAPKTKESKPYIKNKQLFGKGAADMKGGLIVMHTALQMFLMTPESKHTECHILINPDEEIGSIGSKESITHIGKTCDAALIFEPALPDGNLVIQRKGSANFTLAIQGKSAHVGRTPGDGKNAIAFGAKIICLLEDAVRKLPDIFLNIGTIQGGEALNIVPEHCLLRLNIRFKSEQAYQKFVKLLKDVKKDALAEGIIVEIDQDSMRPPKPLSAKGTALFNEAVNCGRLIGLDLKGFESGGVCDGNFLAALGVPTLDTMGVVGGKLHSPEEYMEIDSLAKRSTLAALLMTTLAKQHQPAVTETL